MAATTSGEQVQAARAAAHSAGRRAVWLLVAANTLWAGTYTAGKIALRELSPVELNALRFSLAALILSPALLRGWRSIPRDRATLVTLAQLVVLGWVLNKTLEYVGLSLSTASDTALLISTESLFTAIGVASLIVGLFGAYLIGERGVVPSLGGAGGAGRIIGDVLIVCSLLVEAVYTVRGKSTLARVPPLLFTSATITGSLLVWLPAGAVNVVHSGWPQLSLAGWLGVLYMAGIATALCYWLWFRGLRTVDGSAAAPTLFIQPLVGAALAVLLLGDQLTWATLAGGGLIGISLVLVIWSGRRPAEIVAAEAVP
jgi:drug/metabolite transporter (DMT)-like permease